MQNEELSCEETVLSGLSDEEAMLRKARGQGASESGTITKSYGQILRENCCTLFNLLNLLIALALFAVGEYTNMLFMGVIILNVVIGIAQECKAKRLIDGLSILNRSRVRVLREGREVLVALEDVVLDDVLVLAAGDQIVCDAEVVAGRMEVNEALLTGESDGVDKRPGDGLLSGSAVIAGRAWARVVHVGSENYATKLANAVKREKAQASELLAAMRKVTRFTSVLIVPLGLALFAEAMLLRSEGVDAAVVSSAGALLGMLPKGLVLLISVSLATGVIRLARMKILVQNIYALETLAHVDTLCLDKTGTLTNGRLRVRDVRMMEGVPDDVFEALMGAYMAASDDNNATFEALKRVFPARATYAAVHKIPFSSTRKWAAVSFENAGTLFVGAPERLLPALPEALAPLLAKGYRLLAIAYYGDGWKDDQALPARLQPVCCVVLEDTMRPNVRETLAFFQREGVDVKVISGDHLKTVSMIAKRAGLARWQDAVDLSTLGEAPDYDALVERYSVFARVTPQQKQALMQALHRAGRKVAMTGDGVNDLLALREADCSVAVADGSDACRQLAQVVLLDSDFTHLPQVVMEGRKVVNNVTRTAQVFFIKTIYSVLVSMFCLLTNQPFPFIPVQITLIDAFAEGYPSFLTIVEANIRRLRGRFLPTALGGALPFALAVTAMVILVAFVAPFDAAGQRTLAYLLLIWITVLAVVKSCHPFNLLRVFICITMVLGMGTALVLLPDLFGVAAFSAAIAAAFLIGAALSLVVVRVMERLCARVSERWPDGKGVREK